MGCSISRPVPALHRKGHRAGLRCSLLAGSRRGVASRAFLLCVSCSSTVGCMRDTAVRHYVLSYKRPWS
eukprot:scaffold137334_cov51-Attheya_sp.AAC.4